MRAVAGTPRYEDGGLVAGSVWASLVPPLRFPWIPAFAGITMALRRPHKRMKMGRRVSFFHRLVALPLPTPSGFRPRIGVRGMPSIAGMTIGGPD